MMSDLIFVPREEYGLLADTLDRLLPEPLSTPKGWATLWADLAQSGALAVGLPEDEGGFNDARAVSVVAEQLGRHGAVSPFVGSSAVVLRLLAKLSSVISNTDLRGLLADGSSVATVALLSDRPLNVVQDRGQYTLDGVRRLVPFGAEADYILVEGKAPNGSCVLVLVPKSAYRVERAVVGIDGCPYADIVFSGSEIGNELVLGTGAEALRLWAWCRDAYLTALCADAVGAMATLIQMTGDYLKVRKQFGAPLSSYQVLQHRFVDMDMALTESRTVVEWAAGLLDAEDDGSRRQAVTTTHFIVMRSATKISQDSVQLHGGIGMAQETPIGRYFKRLLTLPLLFGDEDTPTRTYGAAAVSDAA
jgi:alkylation response protein AidB-like acyl-CoA dehydrogenase